MIVKELIEALQQLDPNLPVIQVTQTDYDSDTWTDLVKVIVAPAEQFDRQHGYVKKDAVHLVMQQFESGY